MVDVMERNVIEITSADLQRMRGGPPNDHRSKFLKEKLQLKALSDERAQRWPNTIKALHEKRIQAKKDELAKLERERLELDAREAKLKAERRREMIERANNMLALPHMTSLLLKRQRENTHKEREAQIQYKKRMEEAWKRQDEKWFQMEKRQLEEYDKKEQLKLQKKKEQVKALANARLGQLQECEERKMENKRKKEEEKKYLKMLAEEDLILKDESDRLKQEEIKERNMDMIRGNEEQKARKEEERQRLLKLDREIAAYAIKKEKMMDERKKMQEAKLALKTRQREAISEKLAKMKCKHEQEIQDKADERYEAEKSWERAWICRMEYEASERERVLKNKAYAEHHKKTMGLNRMKEMEAIENDKEDERRALQRMEDEEINMLSLEDIKIADPQG
ncbi:hypothetical protein KP509_05G000900 [Ceratopteris richardii]|uniref:Trichohyalin-plectin-homology domain-containing protein n=1 Tax=Ceratopteris richardii TaxID=49495 RepID=A0A8T2UVF7_CERRI|nr:hypothetical protein KP509_05G000900 [Ceratopteris richardii]